MSEIKATYLVTDMALCTQDDMTGIEREFKSEKVAMKVATDLLASSCGDDAEVWIWKLSHVLSKPSLEPVIDKIS